MYLVGFAAAWLLGRWRAARPGSGWTREMVDDVIFYCVVGTIVGGRLGYMFFYGFDQLLANPLNLFKVWEGGMSFHGGLLGVILAYVIYAWRTRTPLGQLFDGLSLATAPGIGVVRLANFINAELPGRVWDGPWAMRFPGADRGEPYLGDYGKWTAKFHEWEAAKAAGSKPPAVLDRMYDGLFTQPRHPSQLYELLAEGVILYFVLRWLMLRRGWGGGRIAASFLMGYGALRFVIEFFREPDAPIGFDLFGLTRGQWLCTGMIVAGVVVWLLCKPFPPPSAADDADPDPSSA
jgi:phosphatidylglycerol:prolipoprotein diacylglycerol transferase